MTNELKNSLEAITGTQTPNPSFKFIDNIYVASSWKNEYQRTVVRALRQDGFNVYDFMETNHGFHWSGIDPEWESWSPALFSKVLDIEPCVSAFHSDFDAMRNADTCVLVLPCNRSAHLEAGYFIGNGKKLFILLDEDYTPELMYRMATGVFTELSELRDHLLKINAYGKDGI